jgi:uncharacterized protein (TIGR02145 family)
MRKHERWRRITLYAATVIAAGLVFGVLWKVVIPLFFGLLFVLVFIGGDVVVKVVIPFIFEKHNTLPLIDERDGKRYKTVKMPDGKTWMAQNLNYRTDSSWCWGNDTTYCDKYGRLYAWNAAKKACPAGYHLPSRVDWNRLVAAAGGTSKAGKKLISKSGWDKNGNSTDDYGFSAMPGGRRDSDDSDSTFYYVGNFGYWWTATENGDDYAYFQLMHYSHVDELNNHKGYGFSVRCVADRP